MLIAASSCASESIGASSLRCNSNLDEYRIRARDLGAGAAVAEASAMLSAAGGRTSDVDAVRAHLPATTASGAASGTTQPHRQRGPGCPQMQLGMYVVPSMLLAQRDASRPSGAGAPAPRWREDTNVQMYGHMPHGHSPTPRPPPSARRERRPRPARSSRRLSPESFPFSCRDSRERVYNI
eukprot:scaffold10505_cov102-Isochrysis_galbana.AAC.4